MKKSVKEYIEIKPKGHPSHVVTKISGLQIRLAAEKYFKGRLLDIGCGDKLKSNLVSDLVDEHLGVDHVDTLHNENNVDIFATAYKIPVDDASFDCVLCTSVLEHLEEPFDALKEAHRVLKVGGYGIYTVPFYWHIHEAPRDFFRYSKFGLKYLFEKAEFTIVEIKPMAGFWVTFLTELNYYLHKRIRFKGIVKIIILFNNAIMERLDNHKWFRNEDFTWMNLVVVKK